MAGANLPNTAKQIQRMAMAFQNALQGAMFRKQKRKGIRAKWERTTSGWKPKNITRYTYTSNMIASGFLRDNTRAVKVSELDWEISMPFYAKYLIEGRKKGKGIPIDVMQKWIRQKKIKPRGGSGKFAKMDRETLGFLMNRKIKYFGIEGTDFVTPEREDILRRYKSALTKAINKDLSNLMTKNID